MTLSRHQAVHTYKSSGGSEDYYFDVVVDAQGLLTVRNLRTPTGLVDETNAMPESVLDDIAEAKETISQILTEKSADTGTVQFAGVAEMTVTLPAGINNTDYRVVYTTPDGTILRTESKTTASFKAVASSTYGTAEVPVDVTYVVLVAAQQVSAYSGTLTFTEGESSEDVTFSTAFTSDAYRVVLSESDFFKAVVTSKTKTGFTVQLPFTVPTGGSYTVGYDVFVG